MTNTKTCPQCGEVNPLQAAVCPRCGRQFKTTAPPANQQNEPQTVIGSIPPNFGQQNYSQPGSNPPPNFGQQAGYNKQANFQNESAYQPAFGQLPNNNQQSFNPSNYNQPPKKSKAVWWILGGVASLIIVGVVGMVIIGVFVAAAGGNSETLEGTTWRSENGSTDIFGSNARYTASSPDGSRSLNGDLKIEGHFVRIKFDGSTKVTAYRWSISGNKLTLVSLEDGKTNVLTRSE